METAVLHCVVCGATLQGAQRKFCSADHRNAWKRWTQREKRQATGANNGPIEHECRCRTCGRVFPRLGRRPIDDAELRARLTGS